MGKMSAKRRPGTELNHENWDQAEEDEEQGEFPKASEEEIKQRVFKVAKRRTAIRSGAAADDADGESAGAPKTGVFSGFGGFGSLTGAKSSSSPFSFLSSTSSASGTAATVSPFSSVPSLSFDGSSTEKSPAPAINFGVGSKLSSEASASAPKTPEKSSAYYAKLKGLNQSVAAWVSKHVTANPVCLLTPIFDDYARFLKEIESNSSEVPPTTIKTPDFTFSSAASTSKISEPVSKISFGFSSSSADTETTKLEPEAKSSVFQTPSFGASASAAPAFSFGGLPSKTTPSTGFSFLGGQSSAPSTAQFSFGSMAKPTIAPSTSGTTEEEENEEPPKNEFTPVVEEDSLFTKRCKVFVKTGGEFADRGVGQLFIKSAEGGKKTQLLVRADTNLGNILLNILLTDAVPASRMGKNNVMMICIPTPDAKPPAATVLVRVKNAEEADELLAQINEHKK